MSTQAAIRDDRVEIQQLLHAYVHALDGAALDDLVELFHPDGILWPAYAGPERYEGRAALRAYYERHEQAVEKTLRLVRHRVTVPVVEIDGDTATSRCYFDSDSI